MQTVQWQLDGAGFWIWFGHSEFEDRSELYPILRRWMEAFISGYPYILVDTCDDPWVQNHVNEYSGPVAFVRDKAGRRYALVGGTSSQLLRNHQEEYGLSWVGGLQVLVFQTIAEVEAQLRTWDGRAEADLRSFVQPPLLTLTTGGDVEGLYVLPGRRTLPELLERGRQVAAGLGKDWEPL